MSQSRRELQALQSQLQLARKLLTLGMLMQLPMIIEIVLRQGDVLFGWGILGSERMLPGRVDALLWVGSSLLAIAGFWTVCRRMGLWEGDLESTDIVRKTRLLGTRQLAAGVQFFFYLTFFLPLVNLITMAWARYHAGQGAAALAQHLAPRRGAA